ncbi:MULTISPECIES: zonular occludens toxin domain-containing protein [Prauserella salsuginis group]|uniref:Zonular occludens toxin domain-containing protein n=1 Tax=Prauserella salsuginis TaxID=387889 RepID=A0ABW6G286_9PSEU|nr:MULTISPECIES: zonular occludens toxin domain-containing protein [Prauserella salsuginis group]MCR3719927.1 DNA segregation ATPase FtsK/SpoIIIE, S-DNA-T family [Prauserella flava]MCR3736529.1 DNA segregation ATPase FtsK/SpoIIIE, S-DNA-T family [Prauserella salsuginis]
MSTRDDENQNENETERRELAPVHYLPSTQHADTGVDESEVIEGEIVTAEQYRELQKQKALERYRAYRRDAVVVGRVVKTVTTHQRTKTVMRHALAYPVAGIGVTWRRWRDTHGASRYERQMRAAEAAGDQEALRYWQEADVAEKHRRHARVMDWIKAPGQWIKAGVVGLLGLAGFLLVIGFLLFANSGDIADVIAPIRAVVDAVAFTVWFIAAYGVFGVLGGSALGLFYLYKQGREHAQVPTWLSPPAEGDVMDGLPDENTILNALHNLNIRGFNQAVKEGWRIKFITPPTIDGKGWRAQVALPPACPVEEIVKRKATLAHNLVRYPIEVWPTEPEPAVLDLWVAKRGALSGPVDPWPLLSDLDRAQTDYFAGVPAGITIKGDVVRGRLFEANYVFGGMMGSGKSTLAITLVLGAMLDPIVDIDVVVMAENADFEPMKPRLRSLHTGAGDETVDACMDILTSLYEDLSVRGSALREHDARAVTRQIAAKDARLRPRVVVIDECQNLFLGKHGKDAIEVASKLMSTARKYGITLMFLTPEPSKDALPRKIISVASNKACFAIGDQNGNDAVLGTGSYKTGISAVGLEPKTDEGPGDIGTCMQRGFTAKPGLLRSFYVDQNDAHRVTRRAMQLRNQTELPEPEPEEGTQLDPLADIAAVMGDKPRMRTQEVLQRLAEHNRAAYGEWTPNRLTEYLADYDAEPYKSGGLMQVAADKIRDAIAQRDDNGESDEPT